jgi:asparaginyl-tRNA synthetase
MIEPEMAFCTLEDDMQCAEDYVRSCCRHVLDTCRADLEFIAKMIDPTCIERLEAVANTPFMRLSYTDAIAKLEEVVAGGKKFEYPVSWGIDLASEHERYLTEEVYKQPVIVYNYPKDIKAFYMKLNEDGKTVAAMDVLVPRVGELIGGSQREDNLEALEQRIVAIGQDPETYSSYLDMRRYGNVPHSGFGLGFERLVQFTSGIENIRDVIPFPRWPGNALY